MLDKQDLINLILDLSNRLAKKEKVFVEAKETTLLTKDCEGCRGKAPVPASTKAPISVSKAKPFRHGRRKYVIYYDVCKFCGHNGHTIHKCRKKQAYHQHSRPQNQFSPPPLKFSHPPWILSPLPLPWSHPHPPWSHPPRNCRPSQNKWSHPPKPCSRPPNQSQTRSRSYMHARTSHNHGFPYHNAPTICYVLNSDGTRTKVFQDSNHPRKIQLRWVPKA